MIWTVEKLEDVGGGLIRVSLRSDHAMRVLPSEVIIARGPSALGDKLTIGARVTIDIAWAADDNPDAAASVE